MTQADLAGPEYTKSFISQLEGGYADPSLDTLRFLGRRLQMGLSTVAGDAADQGQATIGGLLSWAQQQMRRHDPVSARRAIEIALDIARSSEWELAVAEASLLLAELELAAGDLNRAAEVLDQIAESSTRLGPRVQSRRDLAAGALAIQQRDVAGAAALFRTVLARTRKAARHPDLAIRALLGLGATAAQMGDPQQARRRLESAARLSARAGLTSLRGRAEVRLAHVARMERREDDALQYLSAAARMLETADDPEASIEADISLGDVLLERGRPSEAIAPLRRALDLSRQLRDQRGETHILVLLGRAALAAGDLVGALSAADDAQTLAESVNSTGTKARVLALRGRSLLEQGKSQEAEPLLSEAITRLATADAPKELAEAASALSRVHRARGEHDLANRYQEMAQDALCSPAQGERVPVDKPH